MIEKSFFKKDGRLKKDEDGQSAGCEYKCKKTFNFLNVKSMPNAVTFEKKQIQINVVF